MDVSNKRKRDKMAQKGKGGLVVKLRKSFVDQTMIKVRSKKAIDCLASLSTHL